ncbi:MAG: 50S ribosomal protein L28 [Nitrospinota bacterium]
MSKKCDICGKKPSFGNNVSHAHNTTRRRWNVNLQNVKIVKNNVPRKATVCTRCIRSDKVVKAV